MKHVFRGDLEFCLENFSSLPYKYVIEAYENAGRLQRNQLHLDEKPVALLSSVLANVNRDTKKKKEPYNLDDFCIYTPYEELNIPSSVYGSAAMELIRLNLLPAWALFVFKDLKAAAKGPPPKMLCYYCEDAIILAPLIIEQSIRGMFILRESAYGKVRKLVSPCGDNIEARMPAMTGKVCAEENADAMITRH